MEHHIPFRNGDTIWALLDHKIDLSLSLRGDSVMLVSYNSNGVPVETYSLKLNAIEKRSMDPRDTETQAEESKRMNY